MYGRRQTNWAGVAFGILAVLLLAGASAFAAWEFYQIKDLKAQVENAKVETGNAKSVAFEQKQTIGTMRAQMILAQQENVTQTQARVLQDVAALREVPKAETPTIAQVADVTKLANEPFFAKAENGDYIIAYQKANISILYRPAEKKIINSGTVKVED